jgi:hypothetical protein
VEDAKRKGRRTNGFDNDPVGLRNDVLELESLLHVLGVARRERFARELVQLDDGLGDDVSAVNPNGRGTPTSVMRIGEDEKYKGRTFR